MGPKAKAERVKLRADCYDVLTVGARIFVLVEEAVIELREVDGRYEPGARAELPAGLTRWVR